MFKYWEVELGIRFGRNRKFGVIWSREIRGEVNLTGLEV